MTDPMPATKKAAKKVTAKKATKPTKSFEESLWETLFIDASNMGFLEDRTHKAFADLTGKLTTQIQKEEALNQEIKSQLSIVGITLEF